MTGPGDAKSAAQLGLLVFSWLLVSVPLLWGIVQTLEKASLLFK